MSDEQYNLNIDLNVLNHLGLNLYSNVPAVLSELVANAWDADATRVDISVERDSPQSILVRDNGSGMTDTILREHYLTVGYRRRQTPDDDRTPGKGRQVMGRKGIGKLSAFSIANRIDIFTKHADDSLLAIRLDVEKIREAMEAADAYHPERISASCDNVNFHTTGTELVLRGLQRRVLSNLDENLTKRLARRFSVLGEDFRVFINGNELEYQNRHIFNNLEYSLVYGDFDGSLFENASAHSVPRESNVEADDKSYQINGWIGLVSESSALLDQSDNLNKISVLVRGKLALENILDDFNEGGLYTKYVVGELQADFLDDTDQDDISTSSRQDFVQTDPRFFALKEFVSKELRCLKLERAKLKEKEGAKKALEIPAIKAWYSYLKGDSKTAARKLFGRINQIAVDQDQRKTLWKHGILAFEHLRYKDKLSELDTLHIDSLETVVQLFSDLDDIEATLYHEITQGRLGVIEKFSSDISTDVLERVIQRHICDHLWLLDPSWDRATETPTLEKTVATAFEEIAANMSEEERRGRIDIRYKKAAGKHVIIELKRASILISDTELMRQVNKYKNALAKQLKMSGEQVDIEVVCLVGRELEDWDIEEFRRSSHASLAAKNIRVVLYQTLIKEAELAYANYIEKNIERGRIQELVAAIEES